MKKLIAVITLVLAFSINASAQDKKMSAEESAKKDAIKITEFLQLKENQTQDFIRLFRMKNETINNENLSFDRKKEMVRVTEAKLKASLTPQQFEKLSSNPELLNSVTGTTALKAISK